MEVAPPRPFTRYNSDVFNLTGTFESAMRSYVGGPGSPVYRD